MPITLSLSLLSAIILGMILMYDKRVPKFPIVVAIVFGAAWSALILKVIGSLLGLAK